MLKFYLARHGQDQDNAAGILNGHRNQPLTELGQEQAETLAKKILTLNLTFDKIYSSPLDRAYKTAETFASKIGQSIEILDLLIERDFGVMAGQRQDEIEKLCTPDIIKTNTITYFLSQPQSETFPDLIIRSKKLIEYLNSRHKVGNILLFSHGDFGKMLFAAYYNLPWQEVLTSFHFGNGDLLELSPSCAPEKSKVFEQIQANL